MFPFLQQTQQVVYREFGSFILFTVLKNIEGLREHLPGLFCFYRRLLADRESLEIRITFFKCQNFLTHTLENMHNFSFEVISILKMNWCVLFPIY